MTTTRIQLTLSFFGEKINVNDITKLIGVLPTSLWLKGERIHPNRPIFRKESCWNYSFGFSNTLFFNEASTNLVTLLNNNELIEYILNNNLSSKINVLVEIYNNQLPSIYMSKLFINTINAFNSEIDIDMYYF